MEGLDLPLMLRGYVNSQAPLNTGIFYSIHSAFIFHSPSSDYHHLQFPIYDLPCLIYRHSSMFCCTPLPLHFLSCTSQPLKSLSLST
ncbi:hypothetical protein EYC84_007674 [Monilinia fructicola]|uniref:Uncharacterized protein n=1 Tax=Monilinia fructicola TaxID=38448 RepID=A0A5M9JIW7_MONFR|nr:hypothetical protein EYC84_007674 [Monilinia fructicola]